MSFQKLSASRIHDGRRFLEEGTVLIAGDDGMLIDIIRDSEAGDDVQYFEGILCPGFINCHVHLELSHMKGMIPMRTGLVDFVNEVVTRRHFPDEQILEAISGAESEMLSNGIVAAGDICNNLLSLPQKMKGNLLYHNFIEASGYHPSIAETRFQKSLSLYNEFRKTSPSSIAPHAPYSVSEELFSMIVNFPGNDLQTIHNQETASENEWFRTASGGMTALYQKMNIDTRFFHPTGRSSIHSFASKFSAEQQVILVHNVHTSREDVEHTKKSAAAFYWCLCPNANRYISGELPDVSMLVNEGCNMVVGTDSLASNEHLDMVSELVTLQEFFPDLSTETLLQWATFNGARALRVGDQLGSFEKGKSPGVVYVDNSFRKAARVI